MQHTNVTARVTVAAAMLALTAGTLAAQVRATDPAWNALRVARTAYALHAWEDFREWGREVRYPQDDADGLYRRARGEFNRRNYREAVELFQSLVSQYGSSRYVPMATYYQAFALYRVHDYERSLDLLRGFSEARPDDLTDEARTLMARVEGALAQQGNADAAVAVYQRAEQLAQTEQQVRAAEQARRSQDADTRAVIAQQDAMRAAVAMRYQGQSGDDDDIRLQALNALMQMNAENAMPILRRVLSNQTEDNVRLRRRAVFLVAQKRIDGREEILLSAARTDPDAEVRSQAVFWLSQVRTDAAVDALDSILQFSDERALQERAIFALSQHRSDRAGAILRRFAGRTDASIELRGHAIQWLGNRRGNAAYLRELYPQLDDDQLKERALHGLSQSRDAESLELLLGVARDETESIDTRKRALFWYGQSSCGRRQDASGCEGVNVQSLYDLYDTIGDVELKEQLIFVYSQRRSDEAAVDKLIDIVRNDDNNRLRGRAIFWLGQMDDPRVIALLEEIINQ